MRPVPTYARRMTADTLPRVQPSMAAPLFWREMAKGFEKKEQTIAAAAEEKYAFELNALRKKEIARIETEYAVDPAGMQMAFQKNKEGLLAGIQNGDMRDRFAASYELDTLAPLARATQAKIKQQDIQKKELAFQNVALSETAIEQNIDSLFSSDPEQIMAGGVVIQKSLMDIQNALSVRNHDGSSVFTPEQVAKGMKPYVDRMGELAVLSYLKNAPDKQAALAAFSEGKVEIGLPDGKGGLQSVNLMDAMSEEARSKTRRQVEAYLNDLKFDADYQDVQMKAQYRKERADFDIAMSRGEVNYQGIEEAYNKSIINEEERAKYIKARDTQLEPKSRKSDPFVYNELLKGISLGEITTADIVFEKVGTLEISLEDGNKLVNYLETRHSGESSVLEGALKQVDKSMQKGLMSDYTPAEAEALSRAKNEIMRIYQEAIKQGKSTDDIRKVLSPENVTQVIEGNRVSLEEVLESNLNNMKLKQSDKTETRLPGESIEEYTKRVGK